MEYSMEERCRNILAMCLEEKSTNPIELFQKIANREFVRIHGPEHHILDGAALLTAFYNAGGMVDLPQSLEELMRRGLQMPGATCGQWGVCGAVSSMGAALSIIDGTGPLSADASWGKHMEFTSKALSSLSKVGGPRCCKRDAYLSFQNAIKFINENYEYFCVQDYNKLEKILSESNIDLDTDLTLPDEGYIIKVKSDEDLSNAISYYNEKIYTVNDHPALQEDWDKVSSSLKAAAESSILAK